MNTESKFVNREKRFEVNELVGFDAIVRRDGDEESVFYASLMDFSRRGGKFEMPFCARFDEILSINFVFKDSSLSYSGVGRVRHLRNVGENRWQVGCSLDPPLPEDVVSFLAKQNNQERRRHTRFDIFGEGKLRRQGTPEGCEAIIRNLSRGGFCLIVPVEHEIGEIVDFVIDDQLSNTANSEFDSDTDDANDETLNVGARIRWQKHTNEGYVLGCSFTDVGSYPKLVENLLGGQDSKRDKNSWVVLAAAVLAMLIPIVSSLLTTNTNHLTAERIENPTAPADVGLPDGQDRQEVSVQPIEATVEDSESTDLDVSPQTNTDADGDEGNNETLQIAVADETQQQNKLPLPDPNAAQGQTVQGAKPMDDIQVAEKQDKTRTDDAKVTASEPKQPPLQSASSSRRAKLASSNSKANTNPQPVDKKPDVNGIPSVLTQTATLPEQNARQRNDRGSSRRLKSRRPVMIESEEIVPAKDNSSFQALQ